MQVTSKNIVNFFGRTFRIVLLSLNIVLLLLLLCSYLSWMITPEKFPFFAYIGLGFPFILILNVFFLFFWLFLHSWKVVCLDLFVIGLCYAPIMTYFPVNFKSEPIPQNSIKVLSYNVRAFNWKMNKSWSKDDPMIQYLQSINADIICMQEYMVSTRSREATTKGLQKILKVYPYYSVIPLRSVRNGYEYGLACFSKYPIEGILRIPLVASDNGAALYKINVGGKILSVINVHFESNRLTSEDKQLYKDFLRDRGKDAPQLEDIRQNIEQKLGQAYKKRAPQVDLVAHYVKGQKSDGVIVCGDFNDTPISYSYKQIENLLVDSYKETGFGPGITFHENLFWFRIDFIMHSHNMKAYDFTVDKVKYSDHYPVWTYLNFN